MGTLNPTFTLGIEEEYLIVHQDSLELVQQPEEKFVEACQDLLGDRVTGEYLQCQIEVGTQPHISVGDAVAELRQLRQGVAETAGRFGYAPIAASTHPFSKWRAQTHTRKERYDALRADLGQAVRRMVICGMHIHIGIEDEDLRIDLMNQASYFLPHILALSCSSPFWEGEDTGLASYRLTVFDALPRTGLPDQLGSYAEYQRLVEHLVRSKCLEDGTKIWWDIRPSDKFPTVEARIADVCTNLADVGAIVALYQSVMAYLYQLRRSNQRWRLYPRTLIMENRWRAQRYGVSDCLVDHGRSELVPMSALAGELIEILGENAEQLGCREALGRIYDIALNGNSADRQRKVHTDAMAAGKSQEEACVAVTQHLVDGFLD